MTNLDIKERQVGNIAVLDMDGQVRIGGRGKKTRQESHLRDFLRVCETDEERRAILAIFLDDPHYSNDVIYRAMKHAGLTESLFRKGQT